jgi:hypothetical protein
MEGRFGRMVRLSGERVEDCVLEDAIRAIKRVDPTDALVTTARSLGILFGD